MLAFVDKVRTLARVLGITLASQACLIEGRSYAEAIDSFASPSQTGLAIKTERDLDLVTRSGHMLWVMPAYSARDTQSSIKLSDSGLPQDAFNMTMKSSLPGHFAAESQMASNGFNSPTDRMFQQGKNGLLRARLVGEYSGFGYGTEYRSIGQNFKRSSGMAWRGDQEGHEAWVERYIGSSRSMPIMWRWIHTVRAH
jgi:hypothetical protein